MGINYYAVKNRPTICGPIHIGKESAGWMFLFREYDEFWIEPPIVWHSFDDVKKWLDTYVGEKKTYIIMNEYDEQVSLQDFYEMVDMKQKRDSDNSDNFMYVKNINGYRFSEQDFR